MTEESQGQAGAIEPEAAVADAPRAEVPTSPSLRSQLLGRAMSSASSLASKAGELTDQAATTASKVKDQAATKAAELKDQVATKAGELKDASFVKLVETLDDFNAALPVVREAGYALSNVDIEIGLPPKVSATFLASDDVSAEKVERLLADHAEKKFTLLLMRSLYQAWQLQMKIKIVGLKPKGLAVEIGLSPCVTVKFA